MNMEIRTNILIVSIILISAIQCTNPCKLFTKQDLIQTGFIELTNSISYKDSCHSIPIDFPISASGLKSVASIVSLQGFNEKTYDYSIKSKKKQNQNVLNLYFATSEKQWKKVTVFYFATSREEFTLGIFIVDAFGASGCESVAQLIDVKSYVEVTNHLGKSHSLLTMVSGLRAQSEINSLKIQDKKIDPKISLLSLKILVESAGISQIYIGYIIYREQIFQFKIFKPIQQIEADYLFSSIASIQKGKIITEKLAILGDRYQCSGFQCKNQCVTKKDCLSLSGQIFNENCLICGKNQKIQNNKCVCTDQYIQIQKECVIKCSQNEEYNQQKKCNCKNNFVRFEGKCRMCPQFSQIEKGKCKCSQNYQWNEQKFACIKIELPLILCPVRSKWDETLLTCKCTEANEYLIDKKCQKCELNEQWNGSSCICKEGLFRIDLKCKQCPINSGYNGKKCICNFGFFQSNGKCEKCHPTCGKCLGAGANNCLSCSSVQLTFKDGYCSKSTPCFSGQYLNQICRDCSAYCKECVSDTDCKSCIPGFDVSVINVDNQTISYCTEICGDGRRFEDQCDDGNDRDGDGCSKSCQIQKGYTCNGATTIKQSVCTKINDTRSIVYFTAAAHMPFKIVQGIRITYLPPELTKNDCEQCYKILQIKILKSPVVPSVQLQFMPKSQYQFYCEFDFYGIYSVPIMTISAQINPQFSQYFSEQDLNQIVVKEIDPAFLIQKESLEELTEDLNM